MDGDPDWTNFKPDFRGFKALGSLGRYIIYPKE
jgi:hypothetical protein